MTTKKPKRTSISARIRFEVFKRDMFTCKYCGAKAPDVILEIDHVVPVSKGGNGDILNLLTSCKSCNSGKSDKLLSDSTMIDKQRAQIEELQERKNQIEMLLEWKVGLSALNSDVSQKIIKYFNSKFEGYILNEQGEKNMRSYIKKHGADKVINAIDEACEKYLNETPTLDNFEFIFKRVKSILAFKALPPDKQEDWKRTSEVLRKCRAKFYGYFDYQIAVINMQNFLKSGNSIERLEEITVDSTTFNEWLNSLRYN